MIHIDTHCHLNFDSYDADRAAVIARAAAAGVTRLIIPAVDVATGEEALALAAEYPGIFAAVGVHPNSSSAFDAATAAQIAAQAARPGVVAIGEIGLDYYWNKSPRPQQIAAFEAQLTLAAAQRLPVIIHNREAGEDTLAILEAWAAALPPELRPRPGVLHSFSATPALAERALAAGFYLGFTGPLTFGKAEETRRIARAVPLERLLVETDAPFLTPHPHRGQRNEPAYIPFIVERLATLHGLPAAQMAQALTDNAVRLFHLPMMLD
ncbi:MAG: TatD family hydrolase [Anaerolineae bacterium]|nr:TatD family hydrolase [Anaerolineae bacterium]